MEYHIGKVTSKISKVTGEMAKARHYLSLRTLKAIYDTMVWPYLTYRSIRHLVKHVSNHSFIKATIFDPEKIS